MLARHGLDEDQVAPILAALEDEDWAEVARLTTPHMVEALTIAGTPEECAERVRTDLVDAGIDHVMLGVIDPTAVEAFTGTRPDGLPHAREQLQLIHDRVSKRSDFRS